MNDREKEMLDRLEKATPEEAKKIVLDSLPNECRGVASNFFDCVDVKIKELENNKFDMTKFEEEFNKSITPQCMSKYDMESCLNKYDH